MTRYERQVLTLDDSGYVDVDGRIISVLESPRAGRNAITALVEVGEEEAGETPIPSTFSSDSEGMSDDYPKQQPDFRRTDSGYFCTGEKADGSRCTREVDEPGEKCWQHQDE